MLGGIEAGGTTFNCAIGSDPRTIVQTASFPTRTPEQTVHEVIGFFRDRDVGALGIGSFGPLDLDPRSQHFGAIAQTPKPGWSGFNLKAAIEAALHCPVAIDTDVNASGLAEATLGAGVGLGSLAYVTVGTGIGGGLVIGGRPQLGLTHPEMGHIRPRRHPGDDFAGVCPFHGDCLEGLASGSAIFARTGRHLADAAHDHPVWDIVADYLGQLCASLVLIASPERIVLGGGVMQSNPRLFALVRAQTRHWLAGYVQAEALHDGVACFIVPPALGAQAGIIGGLAMAAALVHAPRIPAR